jgi:hypothetical protein
MALLVARLSGKQHVLFRYEVNDWSGVVAF